MRRRQIAGQGPGSCSAIQYFDRPQSRRERYCTGVAKGSYAAERFLQAARKATNAVPRKTLATKWGTVQG
jgi:hypothetical protein